MVKVTITQLLKHWGLQPWITQPYTLIFNNFFVLKIRHMITYFVLWNFSRSCRIHVPLPDVLYEALCGHSWHVFLNIWAVLQQSRKETALNVQVPRLYIDLTGPHLDEWEYDQLSLCNWCFCKFQRPSPCVCHRYILGYKYQWEVSWCKAKYWAGTFEWRNSYCKETVHPMFFSKTPRLNW